MGCSYTGSAGGAIVIATPNCANAAAGIENIRTASNHNRMLRIVNHLARSSFDCPILPWCCGLRGLKGDVLLQGFHWDDSESVHYDSLLGMSQKLLTRPF